MRASMKQAASPPEELDAETSPTLWTVHDAAGFLRCSTKTVLEVVRHEGLPGFRLRSRLRFIRGDVLDWARRRWKEGY